METPRSRRVPHVTERDPWLNLGGSVVKCTEAGPIQRGVRRQGEPVVFAARDAGIGIASEHHRCAADERG
jgi:hypothetical protein